MNNKVGGDKISFHYRYRKQIIIGTFFFLIIVGSITYVCLLPKKEKKDPPVVLTKKKSPSPEKTEETEYKVDIKGEIMTPGIYTLSSSSRIIDVIEKAGGLTEQANTSVINLSKKITDEMVIIIYSNKEVKDFENTKTKEQQIIDRCIQKDETSLTNDGCISSDKKEETEKVSLNKATLEQLLTLSGIGEAKAKEIIRYREEKGGFQKIEDLLEVSGIGESIFAKIKDRLTL